MTTTDRLLASSLSDRIKIDQPTIRLGPTPNWSERLSIAFEYAAARGWRTRHPECTASRKRPSVGLMVPPVELETRQP